MPALSYQCRPATPQEHELTAQQLRLHTEAAIGVPISHAPFGLLAYNGTHLAGSVVGKVFFNWLHVDLIWVEEARRAQGIGRELMRQAEQRAKEMRLCGIEVWTQSWQAPGFYRKLGYEEFAVIDDFTPGRKRHAFRLRLKQEAGA